MSLLDDLLGKRLMLDDTILPDRKIMRIVRGPGSTITAEDNPATDDGLGSTDVTIDAGGRVVTLSANASPVSDDNGTRYYNDDATGDITINLPDGVDVDRGFYLSFRQTGGHYLKVQAGAADAIMVEGVDMGAASYVRSTVNGACLTIEWTDAGYWLVTEQHATWKINE